MNDLIKNKIKNIIEVLPNCQEVLENKKSTQEEIDKETRKLKSLIESYGGRLSNYSDQFNNIILDKKESNKTDKLINLIKSFNKHLTKQL